MVRAQGRTREGWIIPTSTLPICSTMPHTLASARQFLSLTVPFVGLARKAAAVVHNGFLTREAQWRSPRGRTIRPASQNHVLSSPVGFVRMRFKATQVKKLMQLFYTVSQLQTRACTATHLPIKTSPCCGQWKCRCHISTFEGACWRRLPNQIYATN